MAHLKVLAFQNPEFKILADFNILAFQNPKLKIFGWLQDFIFPKSWIQDLAHFKI